MNKTQTGRHRRNSQARVGRREAIAAMGAASVGVAMGCGGDSTTSPTRVASGSTVASTNSTCSVTPTETIGPYPSLTDLFRSDVREDRQGTRLTLTIKVVNTNASCAADGKWTVRTSDSAATR